jgi:tetratricopeptide (TPR) repeat protein
MSGAVFLSYASQDAKAAKRICEAMRAAGIEVWFDAEGGLEHGDEWDAKIRYQIKECVLFIPLISANTQARHEGYFRIEWELAAERAMGIAHGVPFILPIVIDDTREPDALVPDRFRKVQWTRLPGGVVPPEVQARLLKLWSHRTGVPSHEAARSAGAGSPPGSAVPPRGKVYALAAAALLIAGAVAWWLLAGRRSSALPASAAGAAESAAVAPAAAAAPLSEARQLAARAQPLFEGLDATRDDFALAEDLLKKALAKDDVDAEVWAVYSQLNERYASRGFDASDERHEAARIDAQRALRLDPQSFEARFAQARLSSFETNPQALSKLEQVWRELHRERPDDQRVLRALSRVLQKLNRVDEADALYDESARLPGGDPLALYSKSMNLLFAGHGAEAEDALRAALAQKPFPGALLMGSWYAMNLDGDLDRALSMLNQIPPADLQEDRACFFAYKLYMFRREPDAALDRLGAVPRDWLNDDWYIGPKGLLVGNALDLAGRSEAAAVEWRAALKSVGDRLADHPTDPDLLYDKVVLLTKIGEKDQASREFPILLQLDGIDLARSDAVSPGIAEILVALGRRREAIQQIAGSLTHERHVLYYSAASLPARSVLGSAAKRTWVCTGHR